MSSNTITEAVKTDHMMICELHKNFLIANGNIVDEQRYSFQCESAIGRHALAESMIVYPAFEQYIDEQGKQRVEQHKNHCHQLRKRLSSLSSTSVSEPQHKIMFAELMTDFYDHIKEQENDDLPKLEKAITPEISKALADKFEQAKNSIEFYH